MTGVKKDEQACLSTEKEEVLQSLGPEVNRTQNQGILNSNKVEPVPNYYYATCEKVYQGKNNAFVILGRDRPAGINSGLGAGKDSHCGCIDLIAGMSGRMTRAVEGPKGLQKQVVTNKSPMLDAARIYMSQKTDSIDEYFHLNTEGPVLRSRSAIAIKADLVRVIGREGVRIVSDTDVYNAPGKNIENDVSGIWLIAGNAPDLAEPLVMGYKLEQAFAAQMEIFDGLAAALTSLFTAHVNLCTGLTTISQGALAGAMTTQPPKLLETLEWVKNSNELIFRWMKHFAWENGDGSFMSPWNKTN